MGIVPRDLAPEGYLDLDCDDLEEGLIKRLDDRLTVAIEKSSKLRNDVETKRALRGTANAKL